MQVCLCSATPGQGVWPMLQMRHVIAFCVFTSSPRNPFPGNGFPTSGTAACSRLTGVVVQYTITWRCSIWPTPTSREYTFCNMQPGVPTIPIHTSSSCPERPVTIPPTPLPHPSHDSRVSLATYITGIKSQHPARPSTPHLKSRLPVTFLAISSPANKKTRL